MLDVTRIGSLADTILSDVPDGCEQDYAHVEVTKHLRLTVSPGFDIRAQISLPASTYDEKPAVPKVHAYPEVICSADIGSGIENLLRYEEIQVFDLDHHTELTGERMSLDLFHDWVVHGDAGIGSHPLPRGHGSYDDGAHFASLLARKRQGRLDPSRIRVVAGKDVFDGQGKLLDIRREAAPRRIMEMCAITPDQVQSLIDDGHLLYDLGGHFGDGQRGGKLRERLRDLSPQRAVSAQRCLSLNVPGEVLLRFREMATGRLPFQPTAVIPGDPVSSGVLWKMTIEAALGAGATPSPS